MVEKRLNVVFCGTSVFAVPALEMLAASRHRVVAVVTQPDAPAGRGRVVMPPPVKVVAQRLGVEVQQPSQLVAAPILAALQEYRPDLLVVVAYGRVLPPAWLATAPHGTVGLHASLLPRYRGASPIQRSIMSGDAATGVTTFRVVEEVDAGPIFRQREVWIQPDDTALTLGERMARAGATLLAETVDALAAGGAQPRAQDHTAATYAPKLTKQDGLIDWTQDADTLCRRVRALVPWPSAYAALGGRQVKIWKARVVASADAGAVSPGAVMSVVGGRLLVGTGRGLLALEEVQPEASQRMSGAAFIAGYRLQPGMRFETRDSRPETRDL